MQKVRCVVVDDEPLARLLLKDFIVDDPELELAGEATEADSAVELIESARPDLLFLDVQMPEINGFELLRVLESEGIPVPFVVFVTAHDKYALKAFEENAVDYLLKPFDSHRFQKAVTSAKKRLRAEKELARQADVRPLLYDWKDRRVPVRAKGGRIFFLNMQQIDWIEADGNYLRLHVAGEQHSIRDTMQSFEARLGGHPFVRIHRSMIVNLDRVKEVRPWYTGEYVVYLNSGKELTLTRTYRKKFFEAAGKKFTD